VQPNNTVLIPIGDADSSVCFRSYQGQRCCSKGGGECPDGNRREKRETPKENEDAAKEEEKEESARERKQKREYAKRQRKMKRRMLVQGRIDMKKSIDRENYRRGMNEERMKRGVDYLSFDLFMFLVF